jgi:hypothetical protein
MKNNNYLRKIFLIIDDWKNDFEYSKIQLLRNAFMNARTEHEIDTIVMANLKFIDRVGLWKLANNAKKRIRNLQMTKMKLTEKFYLN